VNVYKKIGVCSCCGISHDVQVSGLIRTCGTACALGSALGLRKPELAILAVIIVLFGDEIEEWLRARCPNCGKALQLLAAVAGA